MPRSELASRIARWRTGEPAGADDADARASSGPSKFWWQNSPAKPAAPPPPRAPATDAHARVNAVVEARTRRLAREGTTAKARVAVRVAESNASDSQSAEFAARELARLSANNPDLREALTLIRRGPDGRVAVGSLRRAEATMYENYARSARASAEMGGETGDARGAAKPPPSHSTRSSADYSGAAYGKTHDPLEMTREAKAAFAAPE